MNCPSCGARNSAKSQFCAKCGTALRQDGGELARARDLLFKGEAAEALALLRPYAAARPADGRAQLWLAHALYWSGSGREALERYMDAARLDPASFDACYQAGMLCAGEGRQAEAAEWFSRALEGGLEESSPLAPALGGGPEAWRAAAWLQLGLARRGAGDEPGALEAIEGALALAPEDAVALSLRGELLLKRGDNAGAAASFDKALGLVGQGPSALALRTDLGVALFRLGRFDQATECFTRVLKADPRNANAIHNLGVVALRQSDPEGLAEGLQEILKSEDAAGIMVSLTASMAAAARREAAETGGREDAFRTMVGASPVMSQVRDLIRRAAATDATVLVLGENGTGKEIAARAIHEASARRLKPFVPVHCAALPESLLESELFGYEKGAFTGAYRSKPGRFELAEGGSLFLDEIGDLDPSLQVKLLRVIQDRRFERLGGTRTLKADVRLIAATNADLRRKVAEGRFREDLFYRLYVIPIMMPPLRQRLEDIDDLTRYFLDRFSRRAGKRFTAVHPAALAALKAHPWPGNVRELENAVERAVALYDDTILLPEYLSLERAQPQAPADPAPVGGPEATEREALLDHLAKARYQVNKAAERMGVSRRTFYRYLKKHNISVKDGTD